MAKKLACEEAAEYYSTGFPALSKRLRAEGPELKAWRNTALDLLSDDPAGWLKAKRACEAYAASIQKARKK